MSPIFVRPVREQLEHDRLIRHLQAKYNLKRKFEATPNVGDERVAPVKIGTATFFPDLVLVTGKKLAGVVEVETGESVNNLEAMAQWVPFSRARVPFHLYVPVQSYDATRRLCEANQARVSEIWTYRPAAEGFDFVRMFHDASADRARRSNARPSAPAPKSKKSAKPASKPSKTVKSPAKSLSRSAAKDSKKPSGARKPAARKR